MRKITTAHRTACQQALTAVLDEDGDGARQALAAMNESEVSRLRNALHELVEMAEARRRFLWRSR
jgi:hypothetical protein